jgi:hypothetical protein
LPGDRYLIPAKATPKNDRHRCGYHEAAALAETTILTKPLRDKPERACALRKMGFSKLTPNCSD